MEEALKIAEKILRGEVGIATGSIQFNNLLNLQLSQEEYIESEFKIFMVVDDDVDHLPIGNERENWSPEALETKDKEIKEVESFYREKVISASKKLINKYK